MSEIPETLQGQVDRFMQLGCRTIDQIAADRKVVKRLQPWPCQGIEYQTVEAARNALYHTEPFRLHAFRSWEDAERWLRGDDAGHDDAADGDAVCRDSPVFSGPPPHVVRNDPAVKEAIRRAFGLPR